MEAVLLLCNFRAETTSAICSLSLSVPSAPLVHAQVFLLSTDFLLIAADRIIHQAADPHDPIATMSVSSSSSSSSSTPMFPPLETDEARRVFESANPSPPGALQYLKNNIPIWQKSTFGIEARVKWLQQHHSKSLDFFSTREEYKASIDDVLACVGQIRSRLESRVASVRGKEGWTDWDWQIPRSRTPAFWTESLLKKMVSLAIITTQREEALNLVSLEVAARLKVRGALRDVRVSPCDIGKVVETLKKRSAAAAAATVATSASSSTVAASASASTATHDTSGQSPQQSPSIERGRGQDLDPLDDPPMSADASSLLNPGSEPSSFSADLPGNSPSLAKRRDGQPPSGHYSSQQAPSTRPTKRQKRQSPHHSPSPSPTPPTPPPPPPPSGPQAPSWAVVFDLFEAQRLYDEARLAAATTDNEREAARANLDATLTYQASLPAHFRVRGAQV